MQNPIALPSNSQTMSSREIAALVKSRHDKVKQSIERLSENHIIQLPPMGEYEIINGLGIKTYATEYIFDAEHKSDSYIVVAQPSPEFTKVIVDRWQELEERIPKFDITTITKSQLALMIIESEEEKKKLIVEVEQKQAVIESQKPAVYFVDKYVQSENLKGFRQVAKLINIKENEFRDFLIENKIMYKTNGEWVAYGNHLDAGRFKPVTGISDTDHAYISHKFTTKGVQWVAGLIASKNVLQGELI